MIALPDVPTQGSASDQPDPALAALRSMISGLGRPRGWVPKIKNPNSPRVAAAAAKRERRKARNLQSETYRTKSGQVLTQADVEALAAEAERGYDVAEVVQWNERRGQVERVQRSLLDAGLARLTFDTVDRSGGPAPVIVGYDPETGLAKELYDG